MIEPGDYTSLLRQCYLFQGLTSAEFSKIYTLEQIKTFPAGTVLLQEGVVAQSVFIIMEGEVEVIKTTAEEGQAHRVARLKQQETVGEMCLLDLEPASATVIAMVETKVLALPIMSLRASDTFSKIVVNIAGRLNQRLRYTNTITVKSLQQELETNKKITFVMRFFITTLLNILLYVIVLNVAIRYLSVVKASTLITVPFLIAFSLMSGYFLKTSNMPAAFFGLTTKNWRASVVDSLKFTIPVMLGLVLFKWVLIHYVPRYVNEPLFNPFSMFSSQARQTATIGTIVFFASLYSAFSIVQEFLVRGILQGSLEYFLQGRHKTLFAILLANLVFSVLHVHISTAMAILVFIPGLLWGYLYYRHKSLIGVSLSHILIGVFTGVILGFGFIFRE